MRRFYADFYCLAITARFLLPGFYCPVFTGGNINSTIRK